MKPSTRVPVWITRFLLVFLSLSASARKTQSEFFSQQISVWLSLHLVSGISKRDPRVLDLLSYTWVGFYIWYNVLFLWASFPCLFLYFLLFFGAMMDLFYVNAWCDMLNAGTVLCNFSGASCDPSRWSQHCFLEVPSLCWFFTGLLQVFSGPEKWFRMGHICSLCYLGAGLCSFLFL